MSDVTHILNAIDAGDPQASAQLLPLVYEELRRLAAQRLAQERTGQTLEATALVHEAYLRLVGQPDERHWNGRNHFFAAAAEAMRRILVETARRKQGPKHGGRLRRLDADLNLVAAQAPSVDLLALDEALTRLGRGLQGRSGFAPSRRAPVGGPLQGRRFPGEPATLTNLALPSNSSTAPMRPATRPKRFAGEQGAPPVPLL